MASHTERAAFMTKQLDVAHAHCQDVPWIRVTSKRFDAIAPRCFMAGMPCLLNGSRWSESQVRLLEPAKLSLHTAQRTRAGTIGNFLSHLNAYATFAEMPLPAPSYLLVLEDDASFTADLFCLLPCLINNVQDVSLKTSGMPFHVMRLGCWGRFFEEDRIVSRVYRAAYHTTPNTNTTPPDQRVAYGGAHATIVQRDTVVELIDHLVASGIMPIDVALRESPGPRQHPASQVGHGRFSHAGKPNNTIGSRLRSYVQKTDAVWVTWDDAHLPGWRPAHPAGIRTK
eukprot:CAMPEP_0119330908 /NCGR_PEP_ID=MMETSP1333-20130426/79284_1 /TAXON_ID=418940 /ORGANISM="Scyphosphaera apsteinii, Strain RCC1455" /LENGTH=283 /DNA_ID=CAMNT_0007340385 /DNA_START=116 /DNA_END=967 /DNA_ORIENTATION=+